MSDEVERGEQQQDREGSVTRRRRTRGAAADASKEDAILIRGFKRLYFMYIFIYILIK